MVTHNIEEAVFMGDRLIVLGHNPGVVRVDMAGLEVASRGREHPEHVRLVDYLYGVMTNPTDTIPAFHAEAVAAAAHQVKATMKGDTYQMLPHAPVGQITGLVERLHHQGDRADLYVLGRELQMEVDDLLPLVQAIDLLGLGDIEEGDVFLTPAGVRFAEAGVLEEKDVFREQAQTHVQLIKRILALIDQAPGKRVRWDTVLDSLADCFSEGEAERQLDTAIQWGRYAELFSYDDNEGVFTRDAEDERPDK
jgi:NitT/TauT family transport system ATP-binding protein